MRRIQVAVLSMCCLASSACDEKRVQVPLPIPAERIDCQLLDGADGRPAIPAEYVIDWEKVVTPAQARIEHDAFITRLRKREADVAGYVVRLEGRLFACANDAQWLREYVKGVK